ncbi:MAG: matrixin family metalloprotease [Reichenbachiella sp.]
MKYLFILLFLAHTSYSYKTLTTYWRTNPKIWTNTSTPTKFRPKVSQAANTWKWAAAKYYPYLGGTTGRDCGDGNDWYSDDDDGYNVIDWWTTCRGGHGDYVSNACNSGTSAVTIIIDTYTGTSELSEIDIVMCSNTNFTEQDNPTSVDYSYHGTLTHELGHMMSLDHTTSKGSTMIASQGQTGTFDARSLTRDDIEGVRHKYGSKTNWSVYSNGGHTVQIYPNSTGGARMYLNPNGRGTGWGNQALIYTYNQGGWIDEGSRFVWDENDKAHASNIALAIIGEDGAQRWLYYSRNGNSYWWNQTGWVDLDYAKNKGYNNWANINVNIYDDYVAEYGVKPLYAFALIYGHFAALNWNTDSGGEIRYVYIYSDRYYGE